MSCWTPSVNTGPNNARSSSSSTCRKCWLIRLTTVPTPSRSGFLIRKLPRFQVLLEWQTVLSRPLAGMPRFARFQVLLEWRIAYLRRGHTQAAKVPSTLGSGRPDYPAYWRDTIQSIVDNVGIDKCHILWLCVNKCSISKFIHGE